jgi:hypothetical protein
MPLTSSTLTRRQSRSNVKEKKCNRRKKKALQLQALRHFIIIGSASLRPSTRFRELFIVSFFLAPSFSVRHFIRILFETAQRQQVALYLFRNDIWKIKRQGNGTYTPVYGSVSSLKMYCESCGNADFCHFVFSFPPARLLSIQRALVAFHFLACHANGY